MAELKPCPFCGKEVKIKKKCYKNWCGEIQRRGYYITCKCGVSTKEYDSEEKVSKVWNRRTENG